MQPSSTPRPATGSRLERIDSLQQSGRRNFAGQNLTNADFAGTTLTGTDFTGAEVRGTNFHVWNHADATLLDGQLPGP